MHSPCDAPLPARDPKGIGGKTGEVVEVDKDGFTVAVADGRIKILRVQPEGGPKQAASDYVTAASVTNGTRFV